VNEGAKLSHSESLDQNEIIHEHVGINLKKIALHSNSIEGFFLFCFLLVTNH